MLAEFHDVKQEPGAARRRWFEDDAMELIVWYGANKRPDGFQLCYLASDRVERALTWRPQQGFTHARVDPGDTRPDKNLSPVLMEDGAVPWAHVQHQFEERSAELDPVVRAYVRTAFAGRPKT